MRIAAALIAGLLFGFGLALSQMIDPAKVLAFLDIAGDWDPSLILVMIGALVVAAPAFWLAGKRQQPFCGRDGGLSAIAPGQPSPAWCSPAGRQDCSSRR
jgi:uncharacterized membrane protein YedE/YeeE